MMNLQDFWYTKLKSWAGKLVIVGGQWLAYATPWVVRIWQWLSKAWLAFVHWFKGVWRLFLCFTQASLPRKNNSPFLEFEKLNVEKINILLTFVWRLLATGATIAGLYFTVTHYFEQQQAQMEQTKREELARLTELAGSSKPYVASAALVSLSQYTDSQAAFNTILYRYIDEAKQNEGNCKMSATCKMSMISLAAKKALSILSEKIDLNLANLANITDLDFSTMPLAGANFTGSTIKHTIFVQANLNNSIFKETKIIDCVFALANMFGSDFDHSYLEAVDFSLTSFWQPANPNGVFVESGAGSFNYSHLSGVYFSNADLRGVTFDNAFTEMVNFEKADLRQSSFVGADLSGAKGLTLEQLSSSTLSCTTKLPSYLAEAFWRSEQGQQLRCPLEPNESMD
jgi:uncharacterized protein YjbI with pentapeptide repeats